MAKVYRDERMKGPDGKPALCIRYKGLDGKYHRERTGATRLEVAEALLRQRMNEIETARGKGLHDLDHLKPVTFGEFYQEKYLPAATGRLAATTIRRKGELSRYVLPFFGSLPLRAINAGYVSDFMGKRAAADPRPSNREINLEKGLVSCVLKEAFRHGIVDVNEAERVGDLKETERDLWLTRAEVDRLLEHAEPWVRPFIVLGVYTGMRRGELVDLKWADLEHSPGWIRVYSPKTNEVRFVPINSAAQEVVEAQPRGRIGPKGSVPWVISNPRFLRAYRGDSVYNSFARAAEKAAVGAETEKQPRHEEAARLREATFHTLRHTFASWTIQAGVPLAEVQQYLGHASDEMTRRYAHLAPAAKERKNALEVLVGDGIGARVAQEGCAESPAAVSS